MNLIQFVFLQGNMYFFRTAKVSLFLLICKLFEEINPSTFKIQNILFQAERIPFLPVYEVIHSNNN